MEQGLKFILVGVLATVFNYMIFLVALVFFKISYAVAMPAGFIGGTIFGYFLNESWTFRGSQSSYKFLRYSVVYLCSLLLGILVITAFVEVAGFSASIANLFTIAVTTITNFFGSKYFVFKRNG